MTLDEAIAHAEEVAKEQDKLSKRYDDASGYSRSHNDDIRTFDAKKCERCAEDHRQLAEWLKDYKRLKEQGACEDVISRQAVLDEAFEVDTSVWSEDAGGERMTLDEAIEHEEEVAEINQAIADNTDNDNWMDIAQCEKCAAEHKQLAAWLKELMLLREQTRWIPVNEELPENGEEVLTCSTVGFIEIQSLENPYDVYWENQQGDWTDFDEVIAWMPLPEPYEPQESEVEE